MKFEFSLPRNTKLKSLNMVINSNDRQHQTDKAKVTKRIRAFAYWHTSMNKDKGRAAFSPSNPCEVTVTIYSPTKSKLDPPNLHPTVKAIIDGMTDAGIWTDDNHKVIKKLSFVYGGLSEEKGHYRLVFDIEEVTE
jgi:putative phage holliday junction resolvase|nr:MAG TPA: Endodeoxyribonuclease RusA [Caudoviricetes sp.]